LVIADTLRSGDELARETYLEALTAAVFAGSLAAPGARPRDVAAASTSAPPVSVARTPDLLLDGFAAVFSGTYGPAVPVLRQAQIAIEGIPQIEQLRWMWGATVAASTSGTTRSGSACQLSIWK
jgi:hypothetical protein